MRTFSPNDWYARALARVVFRQRDRRQRACMSRVSGGGMVRDAVWRPD